MISGLRTSTGGVDLVVDERPLHLSWTWLRDHARDEESYLASANQRLVTPTVVAAATAADVDLDDEGLVVRWPGGPTATYATTLLAALGAANDAIRIGPDPVPWTRDDLGARVTHVDFESITTTDAGLRTAIDGLWRDGVIVVDDVPIDRAATRNVLERFGYLRTTIFGEFWEFSSDGGFDDTASTPLEITPHTDGTYSHDAPGLLGLHCNVYNATGGENVFVDAHSIATRLDPEMLEILRTVDIPGQYIGDGAHLMARRPVFRYDGDRLEQVSYNHHDRAPFLLPEPAMSNLFAALHEFDRLAAEPELQFELGMRPGDMVIFDNWRVLHGRRAFRGERLIAGGYINHEDLESTTRRLASA